MGEILVLLTDGASSDILGYPRASAGPVEYSQDVSDGFVTSLVSGKSVMVSLHDSSFRRIVWWDHQLSVDVSPQFLVLLDRVCSCEGE